MRFLREKGHEMNDRLKELGRDPLDAVARLALLALQAEAAAAVGAVALVAGCLVAHMAGLA